MPEQYNFPKFQDLLASDRGRSGRRVSAPDKGPGFFDEILSFARFMGYMRPNRYCILFEEVPTSAASVSVENSRLSQSCILATIPDSGFMTLDWSVSGPKRTMPSMQVFGQDPQFQFNCGTDLYEYTFFRAWQRCIIDPITRQVGYYNEYAKKCSLTIILLPANVKNFRDMVSRLDSGELYGIRLSEIYPKVVGMNQLQQSSSNNLLVSNVTFGYREIIPYKDWADDYKFAIKAAADSLLDTAQSGMFDKAKALSDDGLRTEIQHANSRDKRGNFLAKEPLGAKIAGGRPNYDHYIVPSTDPSSPPNAGTANVFLNNLLTSGINTAALFRGI